MAAAAALLTTAVVTVVAVPATPPLLPVSLLPCPFLSPFPDPVLPGVASTAAAAAADAAAVVPTAADSAAAAGLPRFRRQLQAGLPVSAHTWPRWDAVAATVVGAHPAASVPRLVVPTKVMIQQVDSGFSREHNTPPASG